MERKELSIELCPCKKFKWHKKDEQCKGCEEIEAKLKDFEQSVVKNTITKVYQKIDGLEIKAGFGDWLKSLFRGPASYASDLVATICDKIYEVSREEK